ncbi:uncharacterized protein [Arachis hypogaea]|uniref:uncharacterized protein isoform X1 n=1 Tax=Arachis hypogaea TaxID=3818 RepID=UPI000DEC7E89|nr:uncharacterized protein LOC112795627 isoform X1 [Arachis hypogaea]QHO36988.1 uncharacterized protein DS421_4g107750 [Arachis hypogaea]
MSNIGCPARMEEGGRLEVIDNAIQKLIKENKNKAIYNDEDPETEYQLALTNLLSAASHSHLQQLEVLQRDDPLAQSEASSPSGSEASTVMKTENKNADSCNGSTETNEIVKELRKIKRQNFVTHCLLSVMIVLTMAWQLSEVSMIMKVKDGINHPFRSFGSMIKAMVKVNAQEDDNNNKEHDDESSSSLGSLKLPEMPHMDVTNLGINNGNQ